MPKKKQDVEIPEEMKIVTVKWLAGLRRADGGSLHMLCIRLVDDKPHLMAPRPPTNGIEGLLDYVAPNPATRKDVRMLLIALGIVFTEEYP